MVAENKIEENEIFFLNYADDRFGYKSGHFRENQIRLNEFAKKQGIKNIVSWSFENLSQTEFYKAHKEYLDKDCFDNGRAWKPYIILELLKRIKYGDIIFYYDCGPYSIKRRLTPVINLCIENGGTVFHAWGQKNSKWTKRDAFVYMNCDDQKYYNNVALQNTWLFIQKNDFNIKFVEEWLGYNLDERIASEHKSSVCGLPELPGFVENRGDQAIFSNLCIKYNIKTFSGVRGNDNKKIDNFILSMTLGGRFVYLLTQGLPGWIFRVYRRIRRFCMNNS